MLSYLAVPIGWGELLKRTARETISDDAQGLASQLAYYFFLALFPALLCLLAIASFFPLQNLSDDMTRLLAPFAPAEILSIIRDAMTSIAEGQDGGLVGLGLLGAIWSSSSAMVAVISAMNRAYDVDESRPWWKVRLTAILITIGLALLIVISFTLVVAGPEIADFLASRLGLGGAFAWTWKILQWPLVFGLVALGMGLIYYFAPDAEQLWVWITPGSLAAAALWLGGSLLFRLYAVNFGDYEASYGAIGGIILLLLWFYLSGLVIVIGAEMNAEIEHASPWGKAPGEKVPGQKKKIGAAAARAYRERHRGYSGVVPPVREPAPAVESSPTAGERLAAWLVLLARWRSKTKN
jgi:membrane protein